MCLLSKWVTADEAYAHFDNKHKYDGYFLFITIGHASALVLPLLLAWQWRIPNPKNLAYNHND
jgi:hypothetical protein